MFSSADCGLNRCIKFSGHYTIWRDESAFRVYMAFLASATHREIIETVGTSSVRLAPGQLVATQAEICCITGYDRHVVRSALDVLKGEGAIECGVPHNRRFSVVTVHLVPSSIQGEGRSDFGTIPPPTEKPDFHQSIDDGNSQTFKAFDILNETTAASPFPENPPALQRNKEYKEKKNILFSSSLLSVLSLWRAARENAGEVYCEDPVTLDGAAAMAELWLDTGKATEAVIASAMARFIHTVKTNEAAKFYTLKTLANSLGTYIEKPNTVPAKRYSWTFTCDCCGYTSASFHREGDTPGAFPCRRRLDRETPCTGTMIPIRDDR